MELKIKLLKWSAGLPVAMLNTKTAEKIGVHPQDRIGIETLSKKRKEISTVVDVVKGLVNRDEIAVSSELKKRLGLRIKEKVEVNLAVAPKSLKLIKKKMDNHRLSNREIDAIIKDIVNNSLSDVEIALFVSAIYKNGMNTKEIICLINAISKSGHQLKLKSKFIADKHSIGGIPGNRTTPLVVPICAVAGLIMPKNSSRAITSAAGTADVIETIAHVEFSIKELKKIVQKTNACMVWGGALGLAPADSKLIRVEKALRIDPEPQLIASIMSKKIAAGSKYILIDIPYGKNAKVDKKRALSLKKKFEYFGKHFKKKLKAVITEGNQPIGNGVGPALELRDIINVLKREDTAPRDLEKKSVFLAGEILEMTGKARKGKGEKMATEILDSGKAFEKFKEIIEAQGGNIRKLRWARFTHSVRAKKSGKIREIKNKEINSLARAAGCPIDKCAGVYLHYHVGEKVKKGQDLLTLHAESKPRLRQAIRFYESTKPIKIK